MSDLPPGTNPFGSLRPHFVWVYAGFWFRVLAWWIDAFILTMLGWVTRLLFAPSLSVTLMNSGPGTGKYQISDIVQASYVPADYAYSYTTIQPVWHWHGHGFYEIAQFVLPALYYILFESSPLQATPGKRACHMRVTDLMGRRIGIGRAAARFFGHFLSFMLMGLGYLMVLWTRRKQALHDLLAGTCVIRRQEEALVSFAPPA
ncbi:RDD domain containing protein [Gluconacetobacter diazotrophicus PA1 5]|uniref:RDD family protein n=2 Tax=Gluconacetobacter diazotrophicus TaxID=33996 RepID=A0A7W4NLZ6_GLUDI|nr:RDD family protein [Gluconacetobacter diazotrophicus]ACI51006.1 RDD domain containing protein [Gluconacetobacter diazotrophicus PA1 5]MBB2156705.1 RDD family protein [Gluconacetobacter diazotrophicus]TWB08539.1 RDD family protein [Gluconacetobacter diazotrophicus]CAP54736.1 putative membrane protein [Gluconacetobacter diazotrophicus PA1 5]